MSSIVNGVETLEIPEKARDKYFKVTKDTFVPINNGTEFHAPFIGKITRCFRTHYKGFKNGVFYELTAENWGPRVGNTKFFYWKKGEKRPLRREQFDYNV